ncbi:MAG: peptide chain release factor N(5)-glutamine methyltransferase [Bacilli bacterium]|nr:peptide chain release factor N(5)-glutamine methyltransferase [Bacilli bacterium]
MKLIDYIKEKEQLALNNNLEKEAIKKLLIEIEYQNMANLIMNYNNEISSHYFNEVIDKYIYDKIPIQYILGYAYFYGYKFKVNKDVLIPRPETELAVDKAIEIIRAKNYSNVLDIGTGSGAIALSIALNNPTIKIVASDISVYALDIAKENALNLNVTNVEFIVSDMFKSITGKFDLIISNPPYIGYDEIDEIEEIVYKNEPHLALFTSDNGVYYYKEIIRNLDKFLNDNGTIIFEIGYKQGNVIKEYALSLYPNLEVEIIKDYNSLDRIVIIRR